MRPSWLWLIVPLSLVAVVGLAALAVVLPPRLVEGSLSSSDRVKEIGDLRTALIAILGGVAVGAGTVVAALNFINSRATLQETQRQNREQLELARLGQVNERFTKAIEQLGSHNRDVRMGGIYALEQIARDSENLHWPIMQILTTYLREHSLDAPAPLQTKWKEEDDKLMQPPELSWHRIDAPPDFLAVADVIRRRQWERDPVGLDEETGRSWREPLDLKHCNLRGANLEEAHLEDASFYEADLRGVLFAKAKIQGAFLTLAQLSGGSFDGAEGVGAYFQETKIEGVNFSNADFRGAHFWDARFRGGLFRNVQLAGSSFHGAELEYVDLRGVDLSETTGITQEQLDSAICDETTTGPPGLKVAIMSSEADVEAKTTDRMRAVARREGREWRGPPE